jgi:hypothetical protein
MRQTSTPIRVSSATGVFGVHAITWLAAPRLGQVIIIVEIMLTITVMLTALYAPQEFSSRAFRLLPWPTSAPADLPKTRENDATTDGQTASQGQN